jgi:type II secretory pathway pseudopilin PulG
MNSVMPKMHRRKQAGYTLLMVVFMVATLIIATAAVAPNLLTQGRREKEAEMVWRGEQYERAIGLYYRKFGKYPTKVEDLTKQTNGVRFLRQAYTDPMNKDDGSWRFIYVGPNGQLIGSLRQTSLLQSTLSTPGLGGALSLGGGLQPLAPPGTAAGTAPGAAPGMNQAPGAGQAGQQTNPAAAANPLEAQPQPLDGTVMGGNIIGVGSKIKKPSVRVYLGGDTYQVWEFIWNPTGQIAVPGQTPANPNANPTGAPNATNPNGAYPNGINPNGLNPNGANPNGPYPNGTNPNGTNPNVANPNPPDGQQPQQGQQAPVVNMPPTPQ